MKNTYFFVCLSAYAHLYLYSDNWFLLHLFCFSNTELFVCWVKALADVVTPTRRWLLGKIKPKDILNYFKALV